MKEGTDLGNINDFKLSLQGKAQTTLEKIVNFIIEDGEKFYYRGRRNSGN